VVAASQGVRPCVIAERAIVDALPELELQMKADVLKRREAK
jgi:hypothetical protein